jgi:hypothetical protein
MRNRILTVVFCAMLFATRLAAHDGLDLAPSGSAPDAWNVVTLCHANLRSLATEERWSEMVIQASLSIQAWRFLREQAALDPERAELARQLAAMEEQGLMIAKAAVARNGAEITALIGEYQSRVAEVARRYDPSVVSATVYGCPMCRGIRELDPATPCSKCGMKLEPRSIPASEVYNTPGEPSVVLTATFQQPLEAGKPAEITLRIARKKDGIPVTHQDLLVVHTEPIHLLIIDRSLTDYHHEHPRPTGVPGEFRFTFTPRKPGSYRVFADLVPVASRVQEYAVCDLPGSAAPEPIADRAENAVSAAADLRFHLHWQGNQTRLRVREPLKGLVRVSDGEGKPFLQLEPIMGAYAHLVAFHEDGQTVIHLHPTDATPELLTDRGGPAFRFQFYAPKAGFYRLFAQVQVGNVSLFPPFGIVALP